MIEIARKLKVCLHHKHSGVRKCKEAKGMFTLWTFSCKLMIHISISVFGTLPEEPAPIEEHHEKGIMEILESIFPWYTPSSSGEIYFCFNESSRSYVDLGSMSDFVRWRHFTGCLKCLSIEDFMGLGKIRVWSFWPSLDILSWLSFTTQQTFCFKSWD